MKQKAILECVECGKRLRTKIWTSITVGKDSQIDNKIFNDEINYFFCDKCGNEGFAWYPVKISNKGGSEKAMVMPSDTDGFDVIELGEKTPCRVFYDFDSLKWEIHTWQGGYKVLFDPPPDEQDIKEALEKNIISKEDAEILRHVDWEEMLNRVDDEKMEVDWSGNQNNAFNLYMKFMYELEVSRKVVSFKK